MGLSMCGHVLAKGHPVTVHSRTQLKTQPLIDRGAVWADSPKAVAEQSDVVVTIVVVTKKHVVVKCHELHVSELIYLIMMLKSYIN